MGTAGWSKVSLKPHRWLCLVNSLGHGGPADPQHQTCKLAKGAEEVWNLFFMPAFQKAFKLQLVVWSPGTNGYYRTRIIINVFMVWIRSLDPLMKHIPHTTVASMQRWIVQAFWLKYIPVELPQMRVQQTLGYIYNLWIPRNVVRQLMLTDNCIEPTYIVYFGTHHMYLCICTYSSFTFFTWSSCVHMFEWSTCMFIDWL